MNKETVSLRKALHSIASRQPESDPFSPAGSYVWQKWTEGCRSIEQALVSAGEEL